MRLTYKQISYLREVARQNSITAACRELHVSQSSVLAAIEIAEDVTGTRLFERRKGHGIDLTPAGQKFLVSARRFLAAGDEFLHSLDEFSQNTSKVLRIGCFLPFGALVIPPVLKKYFDTYGECEILLFEGDQPELRHLLASGDVDLVITYDIGQEFGSDITPICKCPAHAIVRRDDPIADRESVSIKELAKRPLLLLDLPETRTYLIALFDLIAHRPKIGLRTRSYETIRSGVSNGLGVSVLNIRPARNASPDDKNLVRVPISNKLRQPTLQVADPYGPQKPAYVREFISLLYSYFEELGPDGFAVSVPEYSKNLMYPKPVFSGVD